MSERYDLLASISTTTADYREADQDAPTPDHVDRWIKQFDTAAQMPMLREIDHVFKKTYYSKVRTGKFLQGLFGTKELVGDDPCTFWKSVKFLDIQGGGASQKEMLALFSKVLEKRCGFGSKICGATPHEYVYLDDAIFTGNRVKRDLEAWINKHAPTVAKVHVITIALHNGGQYYASEQIKKAAKAAGKNISLKWWRAIKLEDRKSHTTTSDVLRPVSIPDDPSVKDYVAAMNHKPNLRTAGNVGVNGIFSSDAGRQLLETEFLKAGVRIRNMCPQLNQYQRPLGNMVLETLGFGSLIVTFRNCPNNAPLALWAGHPWYPLFPRTTNGETSIRKFMEMLAVVEL